MGAPCAVPDAAAARQRLEGRQAQWRLEGCQARWRREMRLLLCQAPEPLLVRRLEKLQALFSGFRQVSVFVILRF